MNCKHGETGIICAWCDAEQVAALPDADCDNCEYMLLNDPRSGGHCYMFRDKPGMKCGQFREHWDSKKHGTGPMTGDY